MCSVYKLNKQGDDIQPWRTPFPIWIQSILPCPVLSVASSPAYIGCLLLKVKEENEKAGLKLNIQKMKIMASSPITSWEIDEETMETVTDFIFLDSKITADGDCSHEI